MLTKKVLLVGLVTLLGFAGSLSNHFAQSNPATGETLGALDFSGSYDGEFNGGMLTAILAQNEDQLTGYIAIEFSGDLIQLSRLEATVTEDEFTGEARALDGSGTRTMLVADLDPKSKAIVGYFSTVFGRVGDFYIDKLEAKEPLDLNGS